MSLFLYLFEVEKSAYHKKSNQQSRSYAEETLNHTEQAHARNSLLAAKKGI